MLHLLKSNSVKRYHVTILLSFLLTGLNLNGQPEVTGGDENGALLLRLKSMNFIKNNEYSSPITEGYTLLGYFFQPELIYQPSPKVNLRAGAHMLKYWGNEKFTVIRPVFSTTLNISKNTALTLGSLSGSDKHRLFDPDFNSERYYNEYVEDGFQLVSSNDHIFTDTWLSWENFIFKGDSVREVFTGGESFRYTSGTIAEFITIEVPLQLQVKHFGGQISNYSEPVETWVNLTTGLRINFDLAGKRYGQAGIEYLQFFNNQLKEVSTPAIDDGYASWIRLHYTYKAFYFGAAYWKGHNFYAPAGNPIYSSVSDYQENVVIPDRRIITNSFYLNLLPESFLGLSLRFETYYDIDLKTLDNSLALHLDFDKLFRLATIR